MNNRRRMRESNVYAVDWLLEAGYDEVHLKAHGRYPDTVYSHDGNYTAIDFFNLFDGFALSGQGLVTWFQVKTNAWAPKKALDDFVKKWPKTRALAINVKRPTKKIRRVQVQVRKYVGSVA